MTYTWTECFGHLRGRSVVEVVVVVVVVAAAAAAVVLIVLAIVIPILTMVYDQLELMKSRKQDRCCSL